MLPPRPILHPDAGAKGDDVDLAGSADRTALNEDRVHAWLDSLGLRFDPFLPLDAATDPHLSSYLVQHDAFATVWGDWTSFAYAPPGGGKTALRVRTTEACYVGQETNRPFPIPYVPPFLAWGHTSPALEDHLAALARAGATQLLLSLAHRPHWLFRLDNVARQAIRDVLNWNLPGPLNGYLELCRQSLSLTPLRERFNPTFTIPDPPDVSALLRFCDALNTTPATRVGRPSPMERWEALTELLLDTLKFDSIYVLLDGLDAAPETAMDGRGGIGVLSPLLNVLAEWTEKRIFLKGFLPSETQPILQLQFPTFLVEAHVTTIRWTPELLAKVIQERVYVASDGAFRSLDAITSPALRGIETTLALAVILLPREILVLTRRVLWEHVQREGVTGKIEAEDLDAALDWYKENKPTIVTELLSVYPEAGPPGP